MIFSTYARSALLFSRYDIESSGEGDSCLAWGSYLCLSSFAGSDGSSSIGSRRVGSGEPPVSEWAPCAEIDRLLFLTSPSFFTLGAFL